MTKLEFDELMQGEKISFDIVEPIELSGEFAKRYKFIAKDVADYINDGVVDHRLTVTAMLMQYLNGIDFN